MNPPKDAAEEFLKLLASNGGEVTFQQLGDFARRPDIAFGLGVDLIDIILANRDLGRLALDLESKKVLAR